MKCLSLFANVGIGETYFKDVGIDVVVANEFLEDRAEFYQELHPGSKMICGDITHSDVFDSVVLESKTAGVDFIMATPPCQGMSVAHAKKMVNEERYKTELMLLAESAESYTPEEFRKKAIAWRKNYKETIAKNSLFKQIIRATKELNPKYVLIENVEGMASDNTLIMDDDGKAVKLMDHLVSSLSGDYNVEYKVLNASEYSTPHYRKRCITLISRKGLPQWKHPKPSEDHVAVRDVIGDMPSLESGQDSDIKWHSMKHKKHNKHHIKWMKHTPTGKSAFDNVLYYPKVRDAGFEESLKDEEYMSKYTEKKQQELRDLRVLVRCDIETREIKGFATTYKRMDWDRPAPAVTMMNGSINSQNNVHPGRIKEDGTFSDARVLTIKELCAIIGLPLDWVDHLEHTKQRENFLRHVLGECFPPMMAKSIVSNIPTLET
jgi:DNA (cytosine-5)-methyltransferase 1